MDDSASASTRETRATSGPSAAGSSGGAVRRSLSSTRGRWIGGAALTCAVIGLSAALAASPASAASSPAAASPAATPSTSPPNARSGPADGGLWGTVASVSASSFTVTTLGTAVTVDKEANTKYRQVVIPTSARAVKTGEPVLVLGVFDPTTGIVTATQVTLNPTGGTTPAAAGVVPAEPGAAPVTKTVGQIPAGYVEGSGTIVSGETAYKAATAALRAYPGGIVDRVVQVSSTEYEVHTIDRAWPHHVFVTRSFKVVGAY
jgi:hypothetical protein